MWFVNLEIRYFVHRMEYFIHIISVYHTQTTSRLQVDA